MQRTRSKLATIHYINDKFTAVHNYMCILLFVFAKLGTCEYYWYAHLNTNSTFAEIIGKKLHNIVLQLDKLFQLKLSYLLTRG